MMNEGVKSVIVFQQTLMLPRTLTAGGPTLGIKTSVESVVDFDGSRCTSGPSVVFNAGVGECTCRAMLLLL
jgi:hypothetical protein